MNHHPVLLREVLEALDLSHRKVIVDATLGLGGHSLGIFQQQEFSGTILGIDQDVHHLEFAKKRLVAFERRLTLIHSNFAELSTLDDQLPKFDGILFDLGIASPHLDMPERGFSFQHEAPLDMRMDLRNPMTAARILSESPEQQLSQIFREFGEESLARLIARRVVESRREKPLQTTTQLAELVREVYRRRGFYDSRKHPATKVFQALRIAVNDELGALSKALDTTIKRIQPGGRIVVISYHSLEDRMVKDMFRKAANPCICPPKLPVCACGLKPTLRILTKKPTIPSDEEVASNPRARSAKMRVAEKI